MAFFIPGIRALWSRRGQEDPSSDEGGSSEGEDALFDGSEPDELEPDPSEEDRVEGGDESGDDGGSRHAGRRTARTYAREASALVLIASALYCGLALGSYEADLMRPAVVGENWVGPVGEVFARFLVSLVGVVAWLVPLELVLLAGPLLKDRRIRLNVTRASGDVVVAVILAALTHIAFPDVRAFGAMPLGGAVGDLFGEVSRGLFSTVGSFLIGLTIVGLILVERATFSFIEVAQKVQGWLARMRAKTGDGVGAVARAWEKAREVEEEQREAERRASEPLIASPEHADAIIAAFADDGGGGLPPFRRPERVARNRPSVAGEGDSEEGEGSALRDEAVVAEIFDDGAGSDDAVPLEEAETPSPVPAEGVEASPIEE
ncbi:MAG: DNA translocase FtsK 4TM domain-containing protein, partial [Polyangiaceae bacterium]